MRKLLHLVEHKHTARHLPHHHTSYRGLWVVMVVFGSALLFIHQAATAANLNVNAKVAAPIPTAPAEITSPVSGFISNDDNIIVSGACPIINPSIIVVILRDNSFVGSGGCSSNGSFFASVHLNAGDNVLVPIVQTITYDFGTAGGATTISYRQPSIVSPGQSETNSLVVTVKNPLVVYRSDQLLEWHVNISGGQLPYDLTVNWGDGHSTTNSVNEMGQYNLSHVYGGSSTYHIKVSVKDAVGQEFQLSVVAVTLLGQIAQSGGNAVNKDVVNSLMSFNTVFIVYWINVAVIIAFWVGTRYERAVLLQDPARRPRR